MLNIDVSKLNSLISSKKQIQSNNNVNTIDSNNNQSNSLLIKKKKIPPFKVQSFPADKFPLFQKKDFYQYNKKFYNELPNVISPPISFHYTSSNDKFCSFDIMTMMFGLKKSQDILTDPRMNTKIHRDFINNSLNLIFPNMIKSHSDKFSKELKEEIMDIINTKDENEILDEKHINKKDDVSPFFLRRSTLLSSTLNLKKKNSFSFNPNNISKETSKNNRLNEASVINLKKTIENSFESIQRFNEGSEHPHKKNVYAKNVFEVLPFFEFMNLNMAEVIFPNDPLTDIQIDETDKNYILPDKFILKKNETTVENEIENEKNEIYSFFKRENFHSIDETENTLENELKKIKSSDYYSYERDYQISSSNQNEIFNRNLIFIDKVNKIANLLPIESKLFLKKYKKIVPVSNDEDNYELEKQNLGRKRERDLILTPRNINKEEINLNNNILKGKGVLKKFEGIALGIPSRLNVDKARDRIFNRETHVRERRERRETKDNIKEEKEVLEEEREVTEIAEDEENLFSLSENEEDN